MITTLHGTDITLVGNDRSYLHVTRFGIERSDAVTAVSNYLRRVTQDTIQLENQIHVIHNFLPREILEESGGKLTRKHMEALKLVQRTEYYHQLTAKQLADGWAARRLEVAREYAAQKGR